jgi:hypothetical protein
MEWTWVEHPATGLKARIARQALAHHLLRGWVETAAPEPGPVKPAEPASPVPDEVPDAPSPKDVPPPGGPDKTGE